MLNDEISLTRKGEKTLSQMEKKGNSLQLGSEIKALCRVPPLQNGKAASTHFVPGIMVSYRTPESTGLGKISDPSTVIIHIFVTRAENIA